MARKKFRALRDLLDDEGYSLEEAAEEIGRCQPYLSMRLSGAKPFAVQDILRFAELLNIPPEDWVRVFVADYANAHCPQVLQIARPQAV